jgi:hypothetical protein
VADTLWLDLPPGESDSERTQRLLCAQLYYLKGATFEQTVRLTIDAGVGGKTTAKNGVEAWLGDPATIRLLAARHLCLPVEKLLWGILAPRQKFETGELNRLTERAMATEGAASVEHAVGGWTWREIKVLVAHYRFGRLARSLSSSEFGDYDKEEVESILVRSRTRLPFVSRMANLHDILDRKASQGADALKSAGLWRRLVFEYGHVECVPHRELVDWLSPVAKIAGYGGITEANVNVLISGQRLVAQLAAACRAALGESDDA